MCVLTFVSCGPLSGLGMENIGGIFVVLICGLIIAVFVAIMEFVWSTRRSAETDEVCPHTCPRRPHRHTPVGSHGIPPTLLIMLLCLCGRMGRFFSAFASIGMCLFVCVCYNIWGSMSYVHVRWEECWSMWHWTAVVSKMIKKIENLGFTLHVLPVWKSMCLFSVWCLTVWQ